MVTGPIVSGQLLEAEDLNRLSDQFGTRANRPTASAAIEGMIYHETDEDLLTYQVRSGAWVTLTQQASLDPASAGTINTGTDNEDYVTAQGLDGSRFRQIRRLTQAQYDALTDSDKADSAFLYAIVG